MTHSLGSRLRGAVSRVRGKFGPHGVILLYHRIAAVEDDVYRLCVSPQHFEEHLQVVAEIGKPMPLGEMATHVRNGTLPERAVSITFDDGYVDNLNTARPILRKYGIPATIFVTTGPGGRAMEFWWDQLERVFLGSDSLPDRLELGRNGRRLEIDLRDVDHNGADEKVLPRTSPAGSWSLFDPHPPSPRHSAMKQAYAFLQPMGTDERDILLDDLRAWSRVTADPRTSHRVMDRDELLKLTDGGLIEVGGHTVDHPALPSRPIEEQRVQIRACKDTLEDWLGRSINAFAYPYGLFSEETRTEVRREGFDHACACSGRAVRLDSDVFALPRIDAPDLDGDTFARALQEYFSR